MIINILFWISALLIMHTYAFYPLLLILLDKVINRQNSSGSDDYTPFVSVLMVVHNEEKVIRKKIESLFASDYPANLFEVLVGSDDSDDNTTMILYELEKKFPSLRVISFKNRIGKQAAINTLSSDSKGDILLITDANVFPETNCITALVKNFSDNSVGLTDSRLINTGIKKDGIALPEVTYISIESKLKNIEGRLWGKMMGPFGGFYAVRRECYEPNPGNILADDFRICMNVIRKGRRAISDTKAIVYEDVPNNLRDEFNRKMRISAGNFQNLSHFVFLLFRPFSTWSFCFVSHKLLRWITPFLWIILIITNILLINDSFFFFLFFLIQLIFILLPPFDILLKKLSINLLPLRFFTHLYFMNIALFAGFIKYLGGIRSGAWSPTKRFQ
jgi:cellulose synthase/poly-beta-1,6-N-acetylglucosamine synthase-like glycosyltransferase